MNPQFNLYTQNNQHDTNVSATEYCCYSFWALSEIQFRITVIIITVCLLCLYCQAEYAWCWMRNHIHTSTDRVCAFVCEWMFGCTWHFVCVCVFIFISVWYYSVRCVCVCVSLIFPYTADILCSCCCFHFSSFFNFLCMTWFFFLLYLLAVVFSITCALLFSPAFSPIYT